MSIGVVYVMVVLLSVYITNTCCLQNLVRASQQSSQATDSAAPIVNAVLVECPKKLRQCSSGQGQQKQTPVKTSQTPCEDQLIINIRVNPSFQTKKSEKFLILDEVYDPRKSTKAKILAPYLIQISRGEPVMMYPLEFSKSVKSEQVGSGEQKSKSRSQGKKITCDFDGSMENRVTDKMSNGLSKFEPGKFHRNYETDGTPPHTVVTLQKNSENVQYSSDDGNGDDDNDDDEEYEADSLELQNPMKVTKDQKDNMNFVVETNNGDFGNDYQQQDAHKHTPLRQKQNQEPSLANIGMSGKLGQRVGGKNMVQFGLIKPQRYNDDDTEAEKSDFNEQEDGVENLASDLKEESNFKPAETLRENIQYDNIDYPLSHSENIGLRNEVAEMTNTNDEIMREGRGGGGEEGKEVYSEGAERTSLKNPKDIEKREGGADGDVMSQQQPFEGNFRQPKDLPDKDYKQVYTEEKGGECFGGLDRRQYLQRKQRSIQTNPFQVNLKKRNGIQSKDEISRLWNEDPLTNFYRFYGHPNNNYNRNNAQKTDVIVPKERFQFGPLKDNTNSFDRNSDDYNTFNTPRGIPVDDETEFDASTKSYLNSLNYNSPTSVGDATSFMDKKPLGYSLNEDVDNLSENKDTTHEKNTDYNLQLSDDNDAETKKETSSASAYSKDQLPLLSKVLVDWTDRELKTDSSPTFKLDNKYQSVQENSETSNRETLPSPLDRSQSLFSKTGFPQFLPKRLPFVKVIEDPNLSLRDKLDALETIEPRNSKIDDKMNQFYRELLKSYVIEPTPSPLPLLETTASTKLRRAIGNGLTKKKRSFVLYDDLEMRDTLLDNDYNFDDTYQPQAVAADSPKYVNDEHAPCATCGGKGKKTPGKTSSFDPQDPFNRNSCRCRIQRKSCRCEGAPKRARSVTDAWYAVFNMTAPLPFLTTEVRVFRKRHRKWWQIVPSITLNSLSGVFANANLSILFSSHVDIFQLEKSLLLQNHQLLIPKDSRPVRQNPNISQTQSKLVDNINDQHLAALNMNPNNILVIDRNNFDWNSLLAPTMKHQSGGEFREANGLGLEAHAEISDRSDRSSAFGSMRKSSKNSTDVANKTAMGVEVKDDVGVRTIGELGYFPTTLNLLERCPNDKNRLCLNMLEDYVPAYTIKLKLPFRENAIIQRNEFSVKIDRIITDATMKDVLQVSVDVINEGLVIQAFSIGLFNCPFASAEAKQNERKLLIPHVSETLTFLLPVSQESLKKNKQYQCDVIVKRVLSDALVALNLAAITKSRSVRKTTSDKNIDPKAEIIAARALTIEKGHRCFCIWDCQCHCVSKLETYEPGHICKKLSKDESVKAGLLKCQGEKEKPFRGVSVDGRKMSISDGSSRSGFSWFLYNAFILLLIVVLLGLVKAIVGVLLKGVDRWGYGYVQPGRSYECATKLRRFCVNTFFFVVFPFLFWCKCFKPSEDDLLVASTEWQCSVIQDSRGDSDDYGDEGEEEAEEEEEEDDPDRSAYARTKSIDDDEEEEVLLSRSTGRNTRKPQSFRRIHGGEDIKNLDVHLSNWTLAFNEGLFDDDDDADEEANTKFVLQALVESRESLKRLLRGHSSQKLDIEENPQAKQAEELVRSLKSARIVYRVFDRPVGNVRSIPCGRKYCIQGYFLPSLGAEYEFVNYNPLAQHRCISAKGSSIEVLRPPVILCPQEFSRVYKDKLDVLTAGDLFVQPPSNTPCINITTMALVASSVAKLASEQSYQSHTHYHPSRSITGSKPSTLSSCRPRKKPRLISEKDIDEQEKNTTDWDQPSTSQLAFNISFMNDEMMNEKQQLLEDESIDFVDNSSIECKTTDPERFEDDYSAP